MSRASERQERADAADAAYAAIADADGDAAAIEQAREDMSVDRRSEPVGRILSQCRRMVLPGNPNPVMASFAQTFLTAFERLQAQVDMTLDDRDAREAVPGPDPDAPPGEPAGTA